jgi:hypothetical protein
MVWRPPFLLSMRCHSCRSSRGRAKRWLWTRVTSMCARFGTRPTVVPKIRTHRCVLGAGVRRLSVLEAGAASAQSSLGLHDPVPDQRSRQRPLLGRSKLRDKQATRRQRPQVTFRRPAATSSSGRDTRTPRGRPAWSCRCPSVNPAPPGSPLGPENERKERVDALLRPFHLNLGHTGDYSEQRYRRRRRVRRTVRPPGQVRHQQGQQPPHICRVSPPLATTR